MLEKRSGRFRVLLDRSDVTTIANATGGRRVALTVSEVHTHMTLQFKGYPLVVEPPTAADLEAATIWRDRLLDAINQFDGYSHEHLELWSVKDCVTLKLQADEMFDQAPGPGAGLRGRDMTDDLTDEKLRRGLKEVESPKVVATVATDGNPNVTYISAVHIVDDQPRRDLEPVHVQDVAQHRRGPTRVDDGHRPHHDQ